MQSQEGRISSNVSSPRFALAREDNIMTYSMRYIYIYTYCQLLKSRRSFFPECVAKGSRLTLGGLGVKSCSRPVASMFATVRNRSQPFATVRSRSLRRCHWGKLLQVTIHGCVTCQFATLVHCDLRENDMSRKKRDAFRCTGAAFCEICRLLRSSIGISVWRVVFLGCWMWPCH